jgi:predicted RNA-binding Zn-ribbon protein involved in translation (DUF1610 family)
MGKHCNVGKDNPRYGSHPNHTGLNNPNIKDGRTLKKYYCPDCGKELCSYQAKRCRSCSNKISYKSNTNLKHTDKSGKNNGMFGTHRCKEKNPMFGKTQSLESRRLMSIEAGGTGIPYEKSKYDKNLFTDELKDSIRHRDNCKCQNCGKTQQKEIRQLKRKLTVHHIDYNKDNCKKKNLITLCNTCNIRANKNRKYWRNFYQKKVKG